MTAQNKTTADTQVERGAETPPRRSFFIRLLTLALGGMLALFPFAVGLLVFLDPLRTKKRAADAEEDGGLEGFYKVATLDSLPGDGTPRYVKVVAGRADAWTYVPNEPIGAVYLSKKPDGGVAALNVMCPHAGCAVDFKPAERVFECPCHSSSFSITGERSENSPSARNLDELQTTVKDGEIWVAFENFRSGTAERIPVT